MTKLWHISDLHLSFSETGYPLKDMSIFGDDWIDWHEKIFKDWDERVADEDIVLVGGDNAWPSKAYLSSMRKIAERPGRILFIDGNHCKYIRQGVGKFGVEEFRKQINKQTGLEYISGMFTKVGEVGILAQKLCDLPTNTFYTRFKKGYFENELFHLRNLIDQHKDQMLKCKYRIFLAHYPLMDNLLDYEGSDWIKLIKQINPTHCLYGHYHSEEVRQFLPNNHTVWDGINFMNTSLDLADFKMRLVIPDINQ